MSRVRLSRVPAATGLSELRSRGARSADGDLASLQRAAGNAAVARSVTGRALARAAYPPGKEMESGYWGRYGSGIDPRQLGKQIATDLLPDPKYHQAAVDILNMYWIVHIVQAVETARQIAPIAPLLNPAKGTIRVKAVLDFITDPVNWKVEEAQKNLTPDELKALMGGKQLSEVADMQLDIVMQQFAADRRKSTARVNEAKTDAERKIALDALKRFDDERLTALEKLTENRKPDRWKHPDPEVQDAILAAIQLKVMNSALGSLGESADAKKRALKGHDEGDNWCGYFAADNQVKMNMAKDFKAGFDSTEKLWAFFTYQAHRMAGLGYPNRIKAEDGSWTDVYSYHRNRNARRRWYSTAELTSSADLDIRPGDIVTLAVAIGGHKEKDFGDHIVVVHSYDKANRRLFTIGGNDGGYVVRQPGEKPVESPNKPDPADREAREAATGTSLTAKGAGANVAVGFRDLKADAAKVGAPGTVVTETHIAFLGRPSIVDFEDHDYSRDAKIDDPKVADTRK